MNGRHALAPLPVRGRLYHFTFWTRYAVPGIAVIYACFPWS